MPLPALHGRLVQVDDKTVIAPKLSLRGGRRPTWRPEREARGSALGVQSREGTAVPYRLPKKRTDAIGAYHFNGSLFVSAALCRERHAAPLQRHVRLAIVPPNLQSPWCFLPAKGTLRPFFTKKFEKSRIFTLRILPSCGIFSFCGQKNLLGNTAQLQLRPSPDIFRRSIGLKSLRYTKYICTFQTLSRQKISRRMLLLNHALLP